MNGYRFFVDLPGTICDPPLPSKITVRHLRELGEAEQYVNCIAVVVRGGAMTMRAVTAINVHPNSKTAPIHIAESYLRDCKRIPENIARKLHPKLFERLDALS